MLNLLFNGKFGDDSSTKKKDQKGSSKQKKNKFTVPDEVEFTVEDEAEEIGVLEDENSGDQNTMTTATDTETSESFEGNTTNIPATPNQRYAQQKNTLTYSNTQEYTARAMNLHKKRISHGVETLIRGIIPSNSCDTYEVVTFSDSDDDTGAINSQQKSDKVSQIFQKLEQTAESGNSQADATAAHQSSVEGHETAAVSVPQTGDPNATTISEVPAVSVPVLQTVEQPATQKQDQAQTNNGSPVMTEEIVVDEVQQHDSGSLFDKVLMHVGGSSSGYLPIPTTYSAPSASLTLNYPLANTAIPNGKQRENQMLDIEDIIQHQQQQHQQQQHQQPLSLQAQLSAIVTPTTIVAHSNSSNRGLPHAPDPPSKSQTSSQPQLSLHSPALFKEKPAQPTAASAIARQPSRSQSDMKTPRLPLLPAAPSQMHNPFGGALQHSNSFMNALIANVDTVERVRDTANFHNRGNTDKAADAIEPLIKEHQFSKNMMDIIDCCDVSQELKALLVAAIKTSFVSCRMTETQSISEHEEAIFKATQKKTKKCMQQTDTNNLPDTLLKNAILKVKDRAQRDGVSDTEAIAKITVSMEEYLIALDLLNKERSKYYEQKAENLDQEIMIQTLKRDMLLTKNDMVYISRTVQHITDFAKTYRSNTDIQDFNGSSGVQYPASAATARSLAGKGVAYGQNGPYIIPKEKGCTVM